VNAALDPRRRSVTQVQQHRPGRSLAWRQHQQPETLL